jgi:hypothetical protein
MLPSGVFFGIGSTLINAHTLPGQTEGLRVGCGGKNKVFIKPLALGWVEGWVEEWVDRWAEGEGKGGVWV